MKFRFIIIAIILILAVLGGVYLSLTSSFDNKLNITDPLFFTIEQGDTLTAVANRLEADGVIEDADTLLWLDRFESAGPVLAASYEFPAEFTIRELYSAIINGDAISDEVQVTIIEGLTIEEIADEFVASGLIAAPEEFTLAATNQVSRFKSQFDFLNSLPDGQSLEGYLFPDTYRFFQDATVDQIILALLRNFDSKLDTAARQAIERSGKTVHEVVILASIVEREVRSPEEMQVVAGLFQNRLDIGMLLQADSTIGYVTKSGRDRSTFADLEIDSPYNTYKNAGLPPGPISNPGLNALNAAVNPADTDYLFFLTNRTSGQVYYGKTLEEHNRNRQRYLE